MNVRIKLGVAAASVAALALSACGSGSLSGEPGAEGAPSVSVSENVDLANKLPESIKSAGVIKIGVDASYAPNEFLAGDGKTVRGFDVDVFNAVAAKFGVKTEWQPGRLRQHHQRRQRQQVRHGDLVLHHQRRTQEAGQHGELLLRRHPVGHRRGQPQGGRP